MFQPGDLILYGTTGVCKVQEIVHPNKTGTDRNRPYYLLKPLYQDGVIYTPAENGKVPMRPIISAKEANALIDLIPTVEPEVCRAPTLQALSQLYQSAVRSHDCRDLMEMVMSIYAKQKQAEAQKRRLGMVDERFMRQAENLLYGEFSSALGIPFDEVQPYIAGRVARLTSKS
ncbi:CarD family transcriptional regulator [Oscillibacter sp.]|uniref:CarD family transcriptional regulator n=1 Tax=Oscillibacter sp. TaxID=1945593 RepID=UPI00262441C9|nr:CarD family transcriptional regulator [Oscillibacter sp.]MDD3347194.1 CarD family transcriptional regulator [Oscillibacter sp.]